MLGPRRSREAVRAGPSTTGGHVFSNAPIIAHSDAAAYLGGWSRPPMIATSRLRDAWASPDVLHWRRELARSMANGEALRRFGRGCPYPPTMRRSGLARPSPRRIARVFVAVP